MSLTSADSAIAAALLGVDVKHVIRSHAGAESRGAGFSGVAFDAQTNFVMPRKHGIRHEILDGVKTEVGVFQFTTRGKRMMEHWPSLSFEIIGLQFNPQRYIWKRDRFAKPVATSNVEVTLLDGSVVTGPALREMRDHPEPYDIMFDVRVWSKNEKESLLLQQLLLQQLPARHFITAQLADGSTTTWDTELQTINNVDNKEPTLANQDQREFGWVYTYVIETHLDNTLKTELQRTVTSLVETTLEPKT